jgi:Ca-activated chloride channel family protein
MIAFAATPIFLPAGILLLAAAGLARRGAVLSRQELEAFGDPDILAATSSLPTPARRRLSLLLRVGVALAALLALARPQSEPRPASLTRTGRDILVALDLSRSMGVMDLGDSRLQEAKRAAWSLAGATPGDRLGLIVFGGAAFLQLPLTTDLATFQLFLDAASATEIGDPATDPGSALRVAVTTFEHEGNEGHRAVLLVSDGERTEGQLTPAVERIRAARIPVFAVGVGTASGGRVPNDSGAAEGPWHLDDIGRPVISHLVEDDLRLIAEATGGAYARADDPAALGRLRTRLAAVAARPLADHPALERAELFQWPLLLAVLALAAELCFGLLPPSRRHVLIRFAVPLLGMVWVVASGCADESGEIRRGRRLYDAGSYPQAYDVFHGAFQRSGDPAVGYDAGNAQYRMRRYEDAVRTYRAATEGAPETRRRALFNLGNAYVRAAEDAGGSGDFLRRAIAAYEEVLSLDPTDHDAKWNLELALRRQGEVESGGSGGMRGRAQYGRGNMRNEGYESEPDQAVGAMAGGGMGDAQGESAEQLSETQARQLLETLQRQQLSSHEGRPAMTGDKGGRDW